jgi:hypothetical protein
MPSSIEYQNHTTRELLDALAADIASERAAGRDLAVSILSSARDSEDFDAICAAAGRVMGATETRAVRDRILFELEGQA